MTHIHQRLHETGSGAWEATRFTLGNPRRALETLLITIALFAGLLLVTFPTYSYQMMLAGPQYWVESLTSLWWLTLESEGVFGGITVIGYAIIGGMMMRLAVTRTKATTNSGGRGIAAMLPGAFVIGCAGCGAGLLGLIAGVSSVTAVSVAGPVFRGLGIVLAVYYLGRAGDPRACSV
ncbi:hypothetical protein [Halomicrobium urmianum]|uniref:hypothetical protein n=1 Tax=Halomicrobium urmianum TaxID=1586233 RepID=UPI001CDA3E35|nr:hypothetical protein [Halomicrobium urmianum]